MEAVQFPLGWTHPILQSDRCQMTADRNIRRFGRDRVYVVNQMVTDWIRMGFPDGGRFWEK